MENIDFIVTKPFNCEFFNKTIQCASAEAAAQTIIDNMAKSNSYPYEKKFTLQLKHKIKGKRTQIYNYTVYPKLFKIELKQNKRYFNLVHDDGSSVGRYCGKNPRQAACKAFKMMIKKKLHNQEQAIDVPLDFNIRECTIGSKKKVFPYEGKMILNTKPSTYTIGDKAGHKQIVNKYKTIVHSKKTKIK